MATQIGWEQPSLLCGGVAERSCLGNGSIGPHSRMPSNAGQVRWVMQGSAQVHMHNGVLFLPARSENSTISGFGVCYDGRTCAMNPLPGPASSVVFFFFFPKLIIGEAKGPMHAAEPDTGYGIQRCKAACPLTACLRPLYHTHPILHHPSSVVHPLSQTSESEK